MTRTSAQVNIASTPGPNAPVHIFKDGSQRLFFEDGYIHYLHPGTLSSIDMLTVQGLKNAEIHFLGQLVGERTYWAPYLDNNAILNIVDCENVGISGLDAINTRKFRPGNITLESSCAVNVSRSKRISFDRCRMTGAGKSILGVHSGSEISLFDCIIKGYYFAILCGSSKVVAQQLTVDQDNAYGPDSHAAFWVSSGHRHGETNVLYKTGSSLTVDNALMDMKTGRALVSGNGPYDVYSDVVFKDIRFTPNRAHTFGVCVFHQNYNSIAVQTDFDVDPDTDEPGDPNYLPYVSTPNAGFARFVDYYSEPTRPSPNAPIFVDGISSDQIPIVTLS